MGKTLAVIVPVYEEERGLPAFHAELKRVLSGLRGWETGVLYVADRGGDGTLEVLRRIAAADRSTRVLALSSRFGHQRALLAGIDACDSDAAVMMDGDLQHPPAVIPELLALYEQGCDIVRTVREDAEETGLLRGLASRLFYRLINRLSEVPISQASADFRLVSRRVLEVFQKQVRERNLFLRGLFGWVGFRAGEVRFKAAPRAAGASKYSLGRLMRFATEGIVSFSKKPLRAATFVGLAFAALGFLLALYAVVQYFRYDALPSGWATLAVMVPTFSGLQLIFLGVIGEYVGAVFDEVKARPHYIVEERINFS